MTKLVSFNVKELCLDDKGFIVYSPGHGTQRQRAALLSS
jgi:hypothetical protein